LVKRAKISVDPEGSTIIKIAIKPENHFHSGKIPVPTRAFVDHSYYD